MNSNVNENRRVFILEKLKSSLQPLKIEVIDESMAHADHPGAKEHGGGHFKLNITSDVFLDKTELERHRMIYAVLGDAMGQEIHALSIKALTPAEQENPSEAKED